MLINPTNTLSKTYQQLHVRLAKTRIDAAWYDQLAGQWTRYESEAFAAIDSAPIRSLKYREILSNWGLTTPIWDSVRIVHDNPLVTFVPNALYDEAYAGYYLQYHQGVLETDTFTQQVLEKQDMVGVYIPQIGLEEHLGLNAPKRTHAHAHAVLVEHVLNRSKNNEERTMYVHQSAENSFELLVVQNQQMQFYNAFTFTTPVDFIYYILFTAEQLQLNPEHFPLYFIGNRDADSALFQMAYTYVRHVEWMELDVFPVADSWDESVQAAAYLLLV